MNLNDYATLRGEHVSLLPLQLEHAAGLDKAAADGELWKLWYTTVPAPGRASAYIEKALKARDAGTGLPFAVLDHSGEIVGSTRLYYIDRENLRCHIGYTWYASRAQRTALNTEAKYLLLRYAFEELNNIAVVFETHVSNERSRAAIARLGAHQDGILRSHMIMPDGSIRDTVVFSIIKDEWPDVAAALLKRLGR